jgi:hypothetical protein
MDKQCSIECRRVGSGQQSNILIIETFREVHEESFIARYPIEHVSCEVGTNDEELITMQRGKFILSFHPFYSCKVKNEYGEPIDYIDHRDWYRIRKSLTDRGWSSRFVEKKK